MGSVLEVLLEGDFEDEKTMDYSDDSCWIDDKGIYKGSTDVKIKNKIDPGVYVSEMNRDIGLYCRKLDSTCDELFKFSDSSSKVILDEIQLFWEKKEKFNKENLVHKRGILMYGYPGTGKTSTIELLTQDLINRGGLVFKVPSPDQLIFHINFLKQSFRKIEPDTPVITILEDIDKYNNYESELLDFLDGKTQIDHHVTLMTTNDTSNLPGNLLRASRVDLKVRVDLPSEEVRKEFLEFKKVPAEDIDEIVSLTKKFSLADLKEVFIGRYLLGKSLKDSIEVISDTDFEKTSFMDNNIGGREFGI